jgi:hypothetical protein
MMGLSTWQAVTEKSVHTLSKRFPAKYNSFGERDF